MKTYTLEELASVFSDRGYLTEDRFVHYFTSMYGYTEDQARKMYAVYYAFPQNVHNKESQVVLDVILPKAAEVVKHIRRAVLPFRFRKESDPHTKKCILYQEESGDEKFLDVNLNMEADIVAYSAIIQRGCKISVVLDFVENIHDNGKDVPVYDGDIFDAKDKYWGNKKGNVYVCDGGTYKRLLYTKGKGYVRNDEPDYDDGEYNSNVVSCCNNWSKLGNIYIDANVLIDNEKNEA